ncbi:MAG: hypothetical protein ACFNL4_01100 [Corynebacterium matruchotii]|jgi:hypothetical protein|uniref:Maltokinase N-terminal cap domain-containing protein n=2 Tax=Corynebacterium matruchotii TaxID=43768 RepID=E0DBQ8_9CORY|nr:hypothetical protein [Corynebacterium matruchotii]EFM49916.1 hypothetical protein HMPREF0299_5745 [Corynebacterium matruchotii ATCC 14266]KAB1923664.1 hypothetical protein F8196_10195 [Corynebacterium matruchotii]QIP45413.1 hypothetical protein HBA49_07725 [Corynebacterium matruchotii]SPW24343.1 Uncharacterised protein [Corynebacterium matruchotii]
MERIAKIHPTATLNPTKDEILHQQFGPVTNIGAFRFVDPNGKVGIETLLVRETDGALLQFPVTYREQRISDTHEVGTTEHSHLGTRHITKIVADPVAVTEIIRVILEGDTNVQRSDGKTSPYEIRGTGTAGVDTLTLGNIHLKKIADTVVTGHIDVNGNHKAFSLSLPTQVPVIPAAAADKNGMPETALIGIDPETGDHYVFAELII